MNRVDRCFVDLRQKQETGLIVYLTAGDPHHRETAELVRAVSHAGADLVELGIPFSDPAADGPVIQRAMERALSCGEMAPHTIEKALSIVADIRRDCEVPIALFGYANPMLQFGYTRLCSDAERAGADGLLVVDVPPEESADLDAAARASNLVRVPLLAPTTTVQRAAKIAACASGFAYYVALAGVTGAGTLRPSEVAEHLQTLRPALGNLPIAVGFGVKTAEQVRALAPHADAVVVGSALVEAIRTGKDPADRCAHAAQFVRKLKDACLSHV